MVAVAALADEFVELLFDADQMLPAVLGIDASRGGLPDLGQEGEQAHRQAIDFLERSTPMPQVEIIAEVDRYIVCPGQALSYMVGRLEIRRLRAQAGQALGERFDIRTFHDVVLGRGALPCRCSRTSFAPGSIRCSRSGVGHMLRSRYICGRTRNG